MRRINGRWPLFCVLCVFLSGGFPLAGQTAQKIQLLLDSAELTWSRTAQFVLEASDNAVYEDAREAFRFAAEKNWLPKDAAPDDTVRLRGLSLLLTESFGVKGGWMYSLTRSPHYAYRELVFQEIIQEKTDPDMAVSGEQLLFYVGRLLTVKEAEQEKTGQEPRETIPAAALAEETAEAPAEEEAETPAEEDAQVPAEAPAEEIVLQLSSVQFLPNSAVLTDSEKLKLAGTARILQTVPQRNILVEGHTALAGTGPNQLRTSTQRARAVADYLISLGVRTAEEITVRGMGADRPVADNGTPEGMEKNRRVEITILRDGEK